MPNPESSPKPPSCPFAALLCELLAFRGHEAEATLSEHLGRARLNALLAGEEPTFSEGVEIAELLSLPLSTFAAHRGAQTPEIELVIAEILHHTAPMPAPRRRAMSEELLAVKRSHAGLPATSLTLLQLIDQTLHGP